MEQINFFSELNDWKNQEFKNIEREKKFNRNHYFSFKNLGNFGEFLVLLLFPKSIWIRG